MIYAQQAGFFEPLAAALNLSTVRGVALEVGQTFPDIKIIDPHHIGGVQGIDLTNSVDRQVVSAGVLLGLAVISDDRKLLRAAAEAGCDYYNAILTLELLLVRQTISNDEHATYRTKLIELARYSDYVLNYAETVHRAIRKRVG